MKSPLKQINSISEKIYFSPDIPKVKILGAGLFLYLDALEMSNFWECFELNYMFWV